MTKITPFLFLLLLLFASSPHPLVSEEWILKNGTSFQAELFKLIGPMAYFEIREGNYGCCAVNDFDEDSKKQAYSWAENHPTKAIPWSESKSNMTHALKNNLIHLNEEGKIVRYEFGEREEPEFYLVYFSASWCGPCRRFTPEFINSYKHFKHLGYDNFEVIFVSWDHNGAEQKKYMKADHMPWPSMRYGSYNRYDVIKDLQGNGIPCLVIVDRNGRVLHHSYQGKNYVGPMKVLSYARQLLKWSNPDSFPMVQETFSYELKQYLETQAGNDASPKAYYLKVDPETLPADIPESVTVKLKVAPSGYVDKFTIADTCSPELKQQLEKAATFWLFFPKLENGHAVSETISFKLKLKEEPEPS